MTEIDNGPHLRGAEIERLLDDAQAAIGPTSWPRVEALVTAIVDLYGAGLERVIACAREAARTEGDLDESLARDELVSSLLVLHGLHPVPLEARVARALDRLRREIPGAAPLSFAGVEDGIVKLRVADASSDPGRAPSMHLVARAVESEAPEVAGVEIEGLADLKRGGASDGASRPAPAGLITPDRLVRGGRP